ncbi:MAG TPA: glycosyltransferase family 4 protein [Anaerolineae bacterium]|nr:glycosyltransferase family 4 protein [Anaerolineae bacterium]
MRILHLIQRYHPARGGAEIYFQEISAYLAAHGHDVTIVTSDALDFERFWLPHKAAVPTDAPTTHRGVSIRRYPLHHPPLSRLVYPAIRRLLWIFSFLPFIPVQLSHYLARFTPWLPNLWYWLESSNEQFDLVAGMTITFDPLLKGGLDFARRHQIPFVLYPLTHFGAGPKPASDPLSRFYTLRHQIDIAQNSDVVVGQTPTECNFFRQQGLSDDQLMLGGCGIHPKQILGGDADRFRQQYNIQPQTPIVICIASMSYDKGVPQLVSAVEQMWQAGHDIELILIGAILDPFRAFLQQRSPQTQQRLKLLGHIDDNTKKDALAAATLMAMPSRTDSFGIAYLEAWVYGKPVIAARTWGVMDVVQHEKNGLTVPFDDQEALIAAINRLINNPDEAAHFGTIGRQQVYDRYNWPFQCARILDLYTNLHARNHRPA